MLPARNRELDTAELWLRNETVIQCVFLISVPKLIVCKVVDNVPVTLSQMYIQSVERKFKHKAGSCSDDFTKLLKTFCYETVLLVS